MQEQLAIITCLLNGYSTDIDIVRRNVTIAWRGYWTSYIYFLQCSKELDIDVTAAKNCKATRATNDILKKYGNMTNSIDMTFVPSIGLGGVSWSLFY